ncbi:MAG: flagellar hook-basal body complex protein FliE [Oligoflexia bacterium]|nr:flagellar hook-basal body complex protein FliE [Oligoflexia bacterium]
MSISSIEFGLRNSANGVKDSFRSESLVNETSDSKSATSFGDVIKSLVQDANESSKVADFKAQEIVAGRNKDIHGAVLAMEKADVQFRLLSQVRNKVIEAYKEVMRMQV